MERLSMTVDVRDEKGKSHARHIRREGFIPAVLYGRNRQPLPITIAERELVGKVGGNAIIDLTINGLDKPETAIVMVKDFQRHVVKGNYLHVDLHEISLKDRMVVTVPLELEGTPAGLAEGGIITQLLREVEVECLPTEIPSHLVVDISDLGVGDSLEVEKLKVPEGVDMVTDITETIVTISLPTMEEVEEVDEELADIDTEEMEAAEEEVSQEEQEE